MVRCLASSPIEVSADILELIGVNAQAVLIIFVSGGSLYHGKSVLRPPHPSVSCGGGGSEREEEKRGKCERNRIEEEDKEKFK